MCESLKDISISIDKKEKIQRYISFLNLSGIYFEISDTSHSLFYCKFNLSVGNCFCNDILIDSSGDVFYYNSGMMDMIVDLDEILDEMYSNVGNCKCGSDNNLY